VNSEPHTGARPSVRLCVGLTKKVPIFLQVNFVSRDVLILAPPALIVSGVCLEHAAAARNARGSRPWPRAAPSGPLRCSGGAELARPGLGCKVARGAANLLYLLALALRFRAQPLQSRGCVLRERTRRRSWSAGIREHNYQAATAPYLTFKLIITFRGVYFPSKCTNMIPGRPGPSSACNTQAPLHRRAARLVPEKYKRWAGVSKGKPRLLRATQIHACNESSLF